MVTKEDGEGIGEAPGVVGSFPDASPSLLPPAHQLVHPDRDPRRGPAVALAGPEIRGFDTWLPPSSPSPPIAILDYSKWPDDVVETVAVSSGVSARVGASGTGERGVGCSGWRGSTSRYRAGQGPLPGRSTWVAAPRYLPGPGRRR